METKTIKRYPIIDIAKAIGIISVIVGHSTVVLPLTKFRITEFVYLYHLMIFFFCSGFCYNEKNNHDPALFCGKKLKSMVLLFFKYNVAFLLLHNLLSRFSLISAPPYQFSDFMIWFAGGMIFQTNETMLGALWFIPVYFVATVLFALTFSFSEKASKWTEKRMLKRFCIHEYIYMSLFMVLIGGAGIYYNMWGMYLSYHIQTAFLAVPMMFIGWVARKLYSRIEPFLGIVSLVISAAVLYISIIVFDYHIELSVNTVGTWYLFYPISILGVIFCLSLSKLILKISWASKIMEFIGKRTFHYMALHIIVFKLIDWVIAGYRNEPELLSSFPHSYQLGLTYTIVSVALISVILIIFEKYRGKFSRNET